MGSGHTADSHVIEETYRLFDGFSSSVPCIFDFGVNTFKVLKDIPTLRTFIYNFIVIVFRSVTYFQVLKQLMVSRSVRTRRH